MCFFKNFSVSNLRSSIDFNWVCSGKVLNLHQQLSLPIFTGRGLPRATKPQQLAPKKPTITACRYPSSGSLKMVSLQPHRFIYEFLILEKQIDARGLAKS